MPFQIVLPLIFCISYLIYRKCCPKKDDIYDLGRDETFQWDDPAKQRRSQLEKDLAETLEKLK